MKLVLFVVGIILLGHLSLGQSEKLVIGVFTLSNCGGCHDFFLDQLYPNYNRFAKYIDLQLMPLAKGDEDAEYLACMTSVYSENKTIQLDYFKCFYETGDTEKCGEQICDNWNEVQTCKTSGEGQRLNKYYRQLTDILNIEWLPAFIIDDVFIETISDNLLNQFVETLCEILKNPADACGDLH